MCLQYVFQKRPQDLFKASSKTSSRRVYKVSCWRRLHEDFLKLCLEDILKDKNMLHWRRLQDVFSKCSPNRMFTWIETSNKSVQSNVFWQVKIFIFRKCIQCKIQWEKTDLKKISFGENKRYKKCPPFYFASFNSSLF